MADSVVSASDGGYLTRVSVFSAGSFRADLRLSATAPSGATADTLLTGVYVVEQRRGLEPDTLNVTLRVRP